MSEPTELHLERVQATVRRLRVRIIEGPDRDRVMEHYGERLGIGTSPANELTLTDPTVSHYHLELRCEDGVLVKDLGSRNGTFVGDVRISEAVVPIGTRIRIGRTVLALLDATIAPPETPLPPPDVPGLVAASPTMQEIGRTVERLAQSNVSVLIQGETGTGKEMVARAIHEMSARAKQPVHRRRSGRAARDADRVAAVRPRAGRVHGRRAAPGRRVRAGARRIDLPRRDRRAAAGGAAGPARRARAPLVPAPRRQGRHPGRRPRHLGDPPRSARRGQPGDVSRRSVLPAGGGAHRDPAAARAARGHRAAGRALRGRDHGRARRSRSRRRRWRAARPPLVGQRARAAQRRRERAGDGEHQPQRPGAAGHAAPTARRWCRRTARRAPTRWRRSSAATCAS